MLFSYREMIISFSYIENVVQSRLIVTVLQRKTRDTQRGTIILSSMKNERLTNIIGTMS